MAYDRTKTQWYSLMTQAWAMARNGCDEQAIFEVLRKRADTLPLARPDEPWTDDQLRKFAEQAVRKQQKAPD
jgi:nicotinamide riboside kinase